MSDEIARFRIGREVWTHCLGKWRRARVVSVLERNRSISLLTLVTPKRARMVQEPFENCFPAEWWDPQEGVTYGQAPDFYDGKEWFLPVSPLPAPSLRSEAPARRHH